MFKSLHSDTNDGHALNSLHGILQTTSSKLNALLRLRIAKIFPFRYQRWPWTKQPTCNSSKQHLQTYIFSWAENWWESSRQNGDPDMLKSFHSDIKDGHPLNSHLRILQPTSFKRFILLSRNLMEGFRQHGDSEIAKIIPFAYKRLSSTKQAFWNSSTSIFFQTIYPLEQKLDGRLHAT